MTLRKKALVSLLGTLFMFAMVVPTVSAETVGNTTMKQQVVYKFKQVRVQKSVPAFQFGNYLFVNDKAVAQQPEQTTQPEQPVQPEQTTQPEQPAQPAQPAQPEQPQESTTEQQPEEIQQPSNNNQTQQPTNDNQSVGTNVASSEFQQRVVELVNQERAKIGLNPLVAKADLTKVAQVKAEDMATNNYFSHTSPTYGSPFDMMKQFGINYSHAGENIAVGYGTPEKVMEGWMNSEGHKKNILNPNFTEIGVGFTTDGNYWVQEFAKR